MARTHTQSMQEIVKKYREAGQLWPARAKRIAAWAMQNGYWKPHSARILTMCADEIARAMREEYYIDPQGRKVRVKHAATIKEGDEQITIWGMFAVTSGNTLRSPSSREEARS